MTSGLWAAHPRLLDDELLSSWLVRISAANHQKLHTFARSVWPSTEIWTRDIDRCATSEVLETLSAGTGTDLTRVEASTLAAYAGRLFESHTPNGNALWLLPLGVFHRTRKRHGIQFCPACLADGVPYYRRSWRVAFVTICDRHLVKLSDRCPDCAAPVAFHRGEHGDRNERLADAAMRACHECGANLAQSVFPEVAARRVGEQSIVQRTWLDALDRGYYRFADGTAVYSNLFFAGLRILFQNFSAGKVSGRLRVCAGGNAETWMPEWTGNSHSVEQLSVDDRFELSSFAGSALQDWPRSFVSICKDANIVSSDLMGALKNVPYWYYKVVEEHFSRGTYSPTLPEISEAIHYLRRRDLAVSEKSVSRTLGVTNVSRKRRLKLPFSDELIGSELDTVNGV